MNKEKLRHLFPEDFRVRKIKGSLFYILTALFGFFAVFQGSMGILSLAMRAGSGFLFLAMGGLFWGSLAWICYAIAQEALHPFEKSKVAHCIQKAKALLDEGALNHSLSLDPAKITVDYSDYSLSRLTDVYEYIDKETFPENHHSLCIHLRKHMDHLTEQGIYTQLEER